MSYLREGIMVDITKLASTNDLSLLLQADEVDINKKEKQTNKTDDIAMLIGSNATIGNKRNKDILKDDINTLINNGATISKNTDTPPLKTETKIDFDKPAKTEHILFILANSRYYGNKGDLGEFNNTLELMDKKFLKLSPAILGYGENLQIDEVVGRYPEFEEAFKYYEKKVFPLMEKCEKDGSFDKKTSDNIIHVLARDTMKKFNLKTHYDLGSEPDKEQKKRVNDRLLSKFRTDMKENFPEVFEKIGSCLADKSNDNRLVYDYMDGVYNAMSVVSGKISTEYVKNNIHVEGALLGLGLLDLKEKGVIDEKLNILDKEKFLSSQVVKNIPIKGKAYDLSNELANVYEKQKNFPKKQNDTLNR